MDRRGGELMRAAVLVGVVASILGINVRVACAQRFVLPPPHETVRISINAGGQLTSTTFTTSVGFPLFQETARINTAYTVPKGKLFDGGLLYRLGDHFGVGAAFSSFSERRDADVTGSIPHPFFFNTPRTLTGTAVGLERSEFDVHIQAAYVYTGTKYDVVITGGPTIFRVRQDFVSNAAYTDVYPYDTVTFGSAVTVQSTGTKTGFNIGADLGYRLSLNLGVGALVRYSRATASLPLTGSATNVSVDAGGLQVAGGVRFYF
jgi:hypothetical protein